MINIHALSLFVENVAIVAKQFCGLNAALPETAITMGLLLNATPPAAAAGIDGVTPPRGVIPTFVTISAVKSIWHGSRDRFPGSINRPWNPVGEQDVRGCVL